MYSKSAQRSRAIRPRSPRPVCRRFLLRPLTLLLPASLLLVLLPTKPDGFSESFDGVSCHLDAGRAHEMVAGHDVQTSGSLAQGVNESPYAARGDLVFPIFGRDPVWGARGSEFARASTGGSVPHLEPPFHIGGLAVRAAATGEQDRPAVAFDGDNFMVVWDDSRAGSSDIWATRVTPAGHVLDPDGLPISVADGAQFSPAIAYDGENYLVVWEDYRSGAAGPDVYGARLSSTGAVLDPEGIALVSGNGRHRNPAVAFDGEHYFVVWDNEGSDYTDRDILGARVSRAGDPVDPTPVVVSGANGRQEYPAIVYGGDYYLIVWEDGRNLLSRDRDIYGVRMTPAGAVLDGPGIPISTAGGPQYRPTLATDGTHYLVIWGDQGSAESPGRKLVGRRVNQQGSFADPESLLISTATGQSVLPCIAFDGGSYTVAWATRGGTWNPSDFYTLRVSPEGLVIDGQPSIVPHKGAIMHPPKLAFGRGTCLAVWSQGPDSRARPEEACVSDDFGPSVYAATLSPSATQLTEAHIPLATACNWQDEAAAAFDGTNYMVVWTDWRGGWEDPDIYGIRVNPYGVAIESKAIPISTAPGPQVSPDIAFDGDNYVVVWSALGDIYGARVTPEGSVLDPEGILVGATWGSNVTPAIAFGGSDYMVVWCNDASNWEADIRNIFATVMSPSGEVADTEGKFLSAFRPPGSCDIHPAIAFDGSNYVVVWERWAKYLEGLLSSCSYPVDIAGVLLSPTRWVHKRFTISEATDVDTCPSIAFDGANYMVAWQRKSSPDECGVWNVVVKRVSPLGDVVDPRPLVISPSERSQVEPSLTFDGTHYVVTWSSQKDGSCGPYCYDVRGALLDPSGARADSTAIEVSGGEFYHNPPSIAAGGTSEALIAYPCYGRAPFSDSYRVFASLLTPELIPPGPQISLSPNPFQKTVEIRYFLRATTYVRLSAYDAAGRLVTTIFEGHQDPGWQKQAWDGRDLNFGDLPGGVYFISLESGYGSAAEKCVLVR